MVAFVCEFSELFALCFDYFDECCDCAFGVPFPAVGCVEFGAFGFGV